MDTGHTRRELLSTLGRAGSLATVTGAGASGVRLASFPMDYRNLRMATSVLERLSRPGAVDWRYCWAAAASRLDAVPIFLFSTTTDLQDLSPEAGFVSTPHDGLAAGFTDDGRLSTLLFPHTGFTHQVPYYPHDSGATALGAKPHEGGFGGLRVDDRTVWLPDAAVDHAIDYDGDTAALTFDYRVPDDPPAHAAAVAGLRVAERTAVLPGTETLVRSFTVTNPTPDRVDGEFVYHTQANVTDNQQQFVVWHSGINRLTATDRLRWTDRDGPYELLVYGDRPVVRSGAADTGPGVDPPSLPEGPSQASLDVRGGAGDAPRPHPDSPGLLGRVLATERDAVTGRYLSGYLAFDLALGPGESATVSVFVAGGESPERLPAADRPPAARDERTREYWDDVVARIDLGGIPRRYHPAARRAVLTLLTLVDPSTASISASGNLTPSYYPSWPRDGAFAAVALARMGFPEPARRFLGRFLPSVQERNGSFRQCYDSTGGDAGLLAVENDQQPLYAWAVREVHDATGDDEFLATAWPAVEAALDFTVANVADNGLLVAAPDIQEGPSAARQSLWTNAHAYEGLGAGATLAARAGAAPSTYAETATRVGRRLDELFFRGDDYVTEIGFWGPTKDLMDYAAGAVWPSDWAADFDRMDRLVADLRANYEREGLAWIPGELLTVAALDRAGDRRTADELLDAVLDETTPAGYLAEETTADGRHKLGSPLGWSSANLLLVLTERYR
jgi:hypothetical protein